MTEDCFEVRLIYMRGRCQTSYFCVRYEYAALRHSDVSRFFDLCTPDLIDLVLLREDIIFQTIVVSHIPFIGQKSADTIALESTKPQTPKKS